MDDLTDDAGGFWSVSTVSGISYLLELDARIMLRQTDPYVDDRDEGDHTLGRDGDPVHLIRLLHCAVGDHMTLVVNLGVEGVAFTTRISTTVIRIEALQTPRSESVMAHDACRCSASISSMVVDDAADRGRIATASLGSTAAIELRRSSSAGTTSSLCDRAELPRSTCSADT